MLNLLLRRLAEDYPAWAVLDSLTFYSGATPLDQLDEFLVRGGKQSTPVFRSSDDLREKVRGLVDLGLVGLDAGLVDLHPLIRHTVAMLRTGNVDWQERRRLLAEGLTGMEFGGDTVHPGALAQYRESIALGDFDRAWDGYNRQLSRALGAAGQREGTTRGHFLALRADGPPSEARGIPCPPSRCCGIAVPQAEVLLRAANLCQGIGEWDVATILARRAEMLAAIENLAADYCSALETQAWGDVYRGNLEEAEHRIDTALRMSRVMPDGVLRLEAPVLGRVAPRDQRRTAGGRRRRCGSQAGCQGRSAQPPSSPPRENEEILLYLGRNDEALNEIRAIERLSADDQDPETAAGQLAWEQVTFALAALRGLQPTSKKPHIFWRRRRRRRRRRTLAFAFAAELEWQAARVLPCPARRSDG